MTQAERLIRNLCETRRLQVLEGQREALKRFPDTVRWIDLPPRVQALALESRRLTKRIGRIEQTIRHYGFQFYAHTRTPGSLTPTNRDARRSALKESYDRRVEKIAGLRTTAVIESLGKSATEASNILKTLQQDLAKV